MRWGQLDRRGQMLLMMALILAAALTAASTLRLSPAPAKLNAEGGALALSAIAEMCLRESVANATRGGSFDEALNVRLTLASPRWGRLTLLDRGYATGDGYALGWTLVKCEGNGLSFTLNLKAGLSARLASLSTRGDVADVTLRVEAEDGLPVDGLEAYLNGARIPLQRVGLYTFKTSITAVGRAALTLIDGRGIRVTLRLF